MYMGVSFFWGYLNKVLSCRIELAILCRMSRKIKPLIKYINYSGIALTHRGLPNKYINVVYQFIYMYMLSMCIVYIATYMYSKYQDLS